MKSSIVRLGLCAVLVAAGARGQSFQTWDGGGASDHWTNTVNWNPNGAVPNPTTNYVSLAGTVRLTPLVNSNWTILGLLFSNNAGAFVLGGSNLTLTASAPDQNGPWAFEHRGTNSVVVNNGIIIQASTNVRRQFVLSGSGNVTFNGVVSNSGAGNAGLWIRGNNLGTGSAAVQGTLNNRVLLGTNRLSKLDAATWVIGTNGNEWGGTDIYQTGVLRIAAANALPTNTVVTFINTSPGGRLDLNNFNQTVAGLSSLPTNTVPAVRTGAGAGGVLTINSSLTNIFHGSISENGSLVKMGTGRQILMTNSTFTGSVLVAEGVLQLGTNRNSQYFNAAGVSPAAGGGRTLTIAAGAVLDIRGRDAIPATNVNIFISGTLTNEAFTMVGPVTMNGGLIVGGNGLNATYHNLAFRNSVTVTGTATSVITGMAGVTNEFHLEQAAVVFDVRDVTGSSAADLVVSGTLGNGSPNVASAAGGLVKTGAGTMQLDAANTFSGTAAVVQGSLKLGAAGSANTAVISLGTGGVFDVSAYATYTVPASQIIQGYGVVTGQNFAVSEGGSIHPGAAGVAGTLTLNAGFVFGIAGFTNVFDLTNNLTVGGGNDHLVVNGQFEPNNNLVRINPLAPLVAGDYRLISYSVTPNSTTFAGLLGNTTRDTWTLTDTTTGQVFLTVASGTNQSLVWTAQNSAVWDLGTTTNWTTTPGAVQDAFYDLDTVIFDDTGANSNVVNLSAAVKPAAIWANSTSNYVIGGAGRVDSYGSVPGLLVKDGTGSLTLGVPFEIEGPTFVSNGTLQVGSGGTTGSMGRSTVTVSPGATLAYLRNDGGGSPYVISNIIAGAGTVFFNGVAVANTSVYQPTNNNSFFTGQINILASRLQPLNPASLGSGPINVIAGGGTAGSGQLWLQNAGTYTNPVTIAGNGWFDSVTNHGAIRFRSGGNQAGPVTLTNNARVGVFDNESGNLTGPVSGPYELEFFGRNTGSTISVASPVAANYAATRVSGGIAIATNANAFSTGPMVINGGRLRVNGFNFAFSNLSSTAAGGVIHNNSTVSPATLTAGSDGTSTEYIGSFQNGSTQPMNLTKVGTGALTIYNNTATGTAAAAAGTLVISNGSWSGPLTISTGATVVALGGQGLLGQYFPVASVLVNNTNANFGSQAALNRYLAGLNPNTLFQSTAGTVSNSFNFGTAGANFPPNYNAAAVNFQVRWVGKFSATNAGVHAFTMGNDDGCALFINGAPVVNANTNGAVVERTGTVSLAVGQHDIVVAYYQATGGYGFFANVIPPGGTKQPLLNALLASGPGIGSLSGAAGAQLAVSNGLLTIAQSLNTTFDGTISGNGGLQKIGTGVLTLGGANTYTDATVVASGELVVNGGIASTAPFTVQPGARLSGSGAIGGPASLQDSTALQPALLGTLGTLTFSNDLIYGATVTNVFDFSATTNDLLAVAGSFVPSNATVLINPSAALANGLYPIVTFGTLSGTYDPTVFNLNPIASGAKRLSLDYATPNEIRLAVGAGKTLTWNSPTSGIWDVQISSNWKDGVAITNEVFFQGDAVLFDDTPGVTQIVAVVSNTAIWPASITVNTSTNAFTLQIGGSLNGNFAVVKNGTNSFTMSDTTPGAGINRNLGSGGVTVNSGKLILLGQNDGARTAGSGLLTVQSGGVLQLDSANTLGEQGTLTLTPVLLNGGRLRPAADNHMNLLTLQSNAVVERYNSAGGAGLDFYALTGTPARIDVLASSATITNDGRMSILNSVTNTIFNIVDSAAAIDAEFSAGIAGSTTKFIVLTNTGTLLMSGPNDNNTLAGIIENGTLLLGKTNAGIKCFGAGISNAVTIRGAATTVRLVGPGPDQINIASGITMLGGTFDLNGWSESYDTLNGNGGTVLNNAVGTIATNILGENNGNGTFGGIIQNGSGTLAVAKIGTGTQVFTNSNTYTGGTVVRAGTLVLSNSLGNAILGNVQIGIGTANSVLLSGLSEQIPDTSFLTFSSGGAGTSGKLQLMGNTETVAGISILAGTISLIQNAEGETVNANGRFVLNNDAANVSLFENNIIRDRSGGAGTGKLSVVKAGAGLLVLSGSLNHSGPTILSNGTLAINSTLSASPLTLDGGTLAGIGTLSFPATINAGATVQPGYAAVATPLTMSSTAAFAAGSTLSLIANGTGAILRVSTTNNLVIPSIGTVAVGVGPVSGTGTYAVVDYAGTLQGGTVAANMTLLPYPRTVATLLDNTTNTTIDLIVTALGEAIKWTGASDALWNINTTTNWQTQVGLLPTAYLQPATIGDSVLFDDSATGNFAVSIPAGVNPASITVSNSINDYTWTGAAIGGGSGLTKDGTAKLSVLTTNTFGGATVIKAGTVAIASESSLGLAPATLAPSQLVVGAGAKIEILSTATFSANRGIAIGTTGTLGSATFDIGTNATVTIPGILINNGTATGGLTKAGSGTMVLSASNRFTGPVSIQAGIVRLGALGALGPIFANSVAISSGAQLNLNGIQQTSLSYSYAIAGSGPDGRGAIINTNGSVVGNSSVRWLTLTADATVGALGNPDVEGNRWDIYNSQGNGFTLTKVGGSSISMREASTNLQLIVSEGFVYTEAVTNGLGTNNIINAGGYLGSYGNVPGRLLRNPVVLNGGTLSSRGGANAGVVTWAGTLTLTATNSFITTKPPHYGEEGIIIQSDISGTNGLTIQGTASNVVFIGSNTYTGGTIIHGRLQIGTNSASGSIIGNIVDNNQLITQRSGLLELSGSISGTGLVNITGSGTIVFGGSNTYSGATTVSQGSLVVTGSITGAASGTRFFANGGSMTFNSPNGVSTFYGDGFANSSQIGEATTGTLTVAAGTLNILSTNGVVASFGSLRVGIGSALSKGTVVVSGGTLNVEGRILIAANNNAAQGTLTMASGRVNLGIPGSYTTAGDPACGVLWFGQGTNTVNLNGGTLAIFGIKNATSAGVGSTFNFNGGTLQAVADNNTDFFLNLGANMQALVQGGGAIVDTTNFNVTIGKALLTGGAGNDGGLTKLGSGQLTLSAANTYTGGTQISFGTLNVNGTIGAGDVTIATGATLGGTGTVNGLVTSSGTVAPGASAGQLILNGYIQSNTATLAIELGGPTQGADYDLLLVPGAASLNGALNVSFINGYTGTVGSTYSVLVAGGIGGTFLTTNLPALVVTNAWNVEYTANQVILTITNSPPPPPTGYDLYALQITNAADRAYQGDPDGDGYANLLEYATGGDPTNSDQIARMNAARTNGLLALKFTRNLSSTDATLIVEGAYATTNNTDWIGFATNLLGSWGSATNVTEDAGSPANVTAFDVVPAATNRFLRLRVTRP